VQEVSPVAFTFGVGREAPAFTLGALDGSEVNIKQYRGDWWPVVAFLPASSPDAAKRLTVMNSLSDSLWGLRGQVLVISDGDRETLAKLIEQVPALSIPVLLDDGRVATAYGAAKGGELRAETVIVDRAGKIVWMAEGDEAFRPAAITEAFRSIVR
jgi:peroxiredoxin